MKKIFTTLAAALLIGTAANAAITVKIDDKAIENNATVNFGKADFKYDGSVWECGFDLSIDVSEGGSIEATTDNSEGVTFCDGGLGGSCYPWNDNKITQNFGVGEKLYLIHAYAGYEEAAPDALKATFNGTIKSGSETFTFTVNFDNTASLNDIAVDGADAPVRYFNLQGQSVANPAAGNVYIRLQGNKATKVVM